MKASRFPLREILSLTSLWCQIFQGPIRRLLGLQFFDIRSVIVGQVLDVSTAYYFDVAMARKQPSRRWVYKLGQLVPRFRFLCPRAPSLETGLETEATAEARAVV